MPFYDDECTVFYTKHDNLLEGFTELKAPGPLIRASFEAASNPSLKFIENRLGVWRTRNYGEWKLVVIRNPVVGALFPQNLGVY